MPGTETAPLGTCPCSSRSSRKAIDSRDRSLAGPRHLDERELERQARVAALAHVVDRDREQVDEPQDRGLLELVRLRLQPLTCFLARRGGLGNVAEMLREHDLPQVLEQVEDEAAEVVPALRRAPPDT